MKIQDLHGKKIAILGFGKEGKSSLKFLESLGIKDIAVFDKNLPSEVYPGVRFFSGENYLDTIGEFELILKSPGISPFQEKLMPHRSKFISQTEIFFSNYPGKVIGITGTKGKSTCSTLLYTLLQSAGYDVCLVGNIGLPVLDEIDFSSEIHDFVIYELSSYMLQDFTPKLYLSLLNNIYPCHLDWHYDSLRIYKEAKINILRHAEHKVINSELSKETGVLEIPGSKVYFGPGKKYDFNENGFHIDGEYVYTGDITLQGDHNKRNISAIIACLDIILQDRERLVEVLFDILPEFKGLPHRIENIGVYEGITFINDAIATTPESTIAAIETFSPSIQTLFLGGADSGFDFNSLREKILCSKIDTIIAFPDSSLQVFPELELREFEKPFELDIDGKVLQVIRTRSMQTGVAFAFRSTLPGRVALLSCGAPSFSLWKSYIDKAEDFIREVQKYS